MFGIIAAINIKAGFKEQFMESMLGDARGSINDEPGCLRFDVLQDSENPNRIYLMEEYVDEAAFEAHAQQPHFTRWRETTKDWVDGSVEVNRVSSVYPPDK